MCRSECNSFWWPSAAKVQEIRLKYIRWVYISYNFDSFKRTLAQNSFTNDYLFVDHRFEPKINCFNIRYTAVCPALLSRDERKYKRMPKI